MNARKESLNTTPFITLATLKLVIDQKVCPKNRKGHTFANVTYEP